ncbi:MAG: hypothetical protein UV60_C0002G0065 [Parcubacteria group bacterium GW2011_GWA2_43_11]|nr:MAG: hypothetical protein UU89_C0003G0010 [Parcubacteria group bacterium GW2011_GWC2_42_11]KKS86260.1 MAG: hypothetical protein UV60_C0002G0065 [Parcubacteria group bacterium GW2011_GWA2_43_11]
MPEIVLLIVNGKEYVELPLSFFNECQGGVPFVGMKFCVITTCKSEHSASKGYGPNLNVTEVVHGRFRNIIPPEVKDTFERILDKEGYLVNAKTFDTEISD